VVNKPKGTSGLGESGLWGPWPKYNLSNRKERNKF